MKRACEINPEEVSHALMRLLLDMGSLELLTRLLERETFKATGVDANLITREYVKHGLRINERLSTATSSHSTTGAAAPDGFNTINDTPSGRDEQIQAVKLLIMYMKNYLRKGLLLVQELLFDIEGLCVQYIWIAEVWESRRSLEGRYIFG